MEQPTCSPDTAVDQAGTTIGRYFAFAVERIDKVFGEGYAKANPTLVAEFIRSQSMDYATTAFVDVFYEFHHSLDYIADKLGEIGTAIQTKEGDEYG